MDLDQFVYHFPFFRARRSSLEEAAPYFIPFRSAKGTQILAPGDECQAIPFLYSGTIRVFQSSETGKELTLYTIEPGESCILTSTCILQTQFFPAFAEVLQDTAGAALPAAVLKKLSGTSEDWRTFIFQLYGQRLYSLLELLSAVSFQRLDERLWQFLLRRQNSGRITLTHGEIARELGTTREVVSRLLKEWEIQGTVTLGRGFMQICDKSH